MGGPEGPRRPSRVGSLSNGDSKRMPNKDWMEELSKMFPAEMAETRKKVRKEVERSIKAAKFLVAAQVCFVLAIVLVKQCIDHFTPAGFTAVRALVSLPFILALAKSDAKSWREFVGSWRELFSSGYLVFLGILVSLGQMLLVLGLERVSVGNTVVLGQLVPVYSATIAVFQGVESPSVGKFTAIAAGVIGAAVMLDPSQMWLSLGNMLLLGRAAVFAAYLALQAPVLRAYLPVTVAATCQIVGAVIAVAVGIPLALTGKGGAVGVMGGMRGTPGVAWIMAIAVAALSAAGYTLTARAERRTTRGCHRVLQHAPASHRADDHDCARRVPGYQEPPGQRPDHDRWVRRGRAQHQRQEAVEAELSPGGRRGGQKLQARRREARDGENRRVWGRRCKRG